MSLLLLTKGNDITAWRAGSDFTTRYREALLNRMASSRSDESIKLLDDSRAELLHLAEEHTRHSAEIARILQAMSEDGDLAPLVRQGFEEAYRHFDMFRSVRAFYGTAHELLTAAVTSLARQTAARMGASGRQLPEFSLAAVGPAGRLEFSPHCPLHLLLIHEPCPPAGESAVAALCEQLHTELTRCGIPIDREVSPLHPEWRGSREAWGHRIAGGLDSGKPETLIALSRLADQTPLVASELGTSFKQQCLKTLREHQGARENLIFRLKGLNNGLGLMGRLRLERGGKYHGLFDLLDNALIPLTAVIGALTLSFGGSATGTPQRIRELLDLRVLDVDLTERLMMAWHTLNELRLGQESAPYLSAKSSSMYLDPDRLDNATHEELHAALDSFSVLQRQALMAFSLAGE